MTLAFGPLNDLNGNLCGKNAHFGETCGLARIFHPVAGKMHSSFLYFMENLGILTKCKMLPGIAERAFAPVSPSICGICSIINSLGY